MNGVRRVLRALLCLAIAGPAMALDARVVARVAADGPFWIGQRIVVEIDLLSDGVSFSGQRFDLPDQPAVVVVLPVSATMPVSERVDGGSWQGLRYELSLFALEAGTIEVPPITVTFAVAVAYGSDPQAFELHTEPLRLDVRRPPGAARGLPLVTASHFELETLWEPSSVDLQVGDALTLTVRRLADGVPGAAIPAFVPATLDGLQAYPDEPEIKDRAGRGELTGERIDRVTYVLQAPGDFRLPGQTFYWFDPDTTTLHAEDLEPLEFAVKPNPAARVSPDASQWMRSPQRYWTWLAAAMLLTVGLLGARWLAPRMAAYWRTRRAARAASEAGRFAALLVACRHGDPRTADQALGDWLRRVAPGPTTATAYANAADDAAFADAVAELQAAMAHADTRWSGEALAGALRRVRSDRQTAQRQSPLPPLNPLR